MLTPEAIIDLRRALGLTADQFGERIGVTRNTVFQWESGRRHPNYQRQVKLNELLGEVDQNRKMVGA